MKNKHLDSIKQSIVQNLNKTYGYCGLADGPNIAIINSGNGPDNFVITIEDRVEPTKETDG